VRGGGGEGLTENKVGVDKDKVRGERQRMWGGGGIR
jgi:hypothetical protein